MNANSSITLKENCPVSRLDLLKYLDQYKIGTRLLFAGNLTRQPYFEGRAYRISGELANTDNIMNNTLWDWRLSRTERRNAEFRSRETRSVLWREFLMALIYRLKGSKKMELC